MIDALLPCPFCGCTNVYPVSPSLGHSSWRVFCDDCHTEGPQIPSCNSDEGEARCQWVWQIRQPTQSNAEIIAENKRLREALTPSGATKAAYIGEFIFTVTRFDEDGEEYPERHYVPWTTVKEIMGAIAARAALKGKDQ